MNPPDLLAALSALLESPLLARALLAAGIVAAGVAGYALMNRLLLRRARRRAEASGAAPLVPPGVPAILYFTTPECAPCKTIQRPALRRLQDLLGDRLRVIEVDAQQQPELARQYGVLSVPTTFIIDAGGTLRHVNHGATRAETLQRQLDSIS